MNTLLKVLKTKPNSLIIKIANIVFVVVCFVLISMVCWTFLNKDFNNMTAVSQLKWRLLESFQVLILVILLVFRIRSRSTMTKMLLSMYIFFSIIPLNVLGFPLDKINMNSNSCS